MAKFNKGLRSVEVHTRIGDVFTATDTVEEPKASWAYDEFIKYGTMHILADPKDFIPYHAVDYLVFSTSVGEMEKGDPYCKGGASGNVACEGKTCEMTLNC